MLFLAVVLVLGASAATYANGEDGENERNGNLVRTQIPVNRPPDFPPLPFTMVRNYIYHEPGMPMLLTMDFSGPQETWSWMADELAALRETDVFLHRAFLAGWRNTSIIPRELFVTVYVYGREFQGTMTRAKESAVANAAGNVIGWDDAPTPFVDWDGSRSWGAHFNGVLTFTGNFEPEWENGFLSETFFDLGDIGEIDPNDPQFFDFDITTLDDEELAELGFRWCEDFERENVGETDETGEINEIDDIQEIDTLSLAENASFADIADVPAVQNITRLVGSRVYEGEVPLVGLVMYAAFEWVATYSGDVPFAGILLTAAEWEGLPDIVVSGFSPTYDNTKTEEILPSSGEFDENKHHYRQFFGD